MRTAPASRNPVVSLGTVVEPWGEVVQIGILSGERYYWLIDKLGGVSMMPADVIEAQDLQAGVTQGEG